MPKNLSPLVRVGMNMLRRGISFRMPQLTLTTRQPSCILRRLKRQSRSFRLTKFIADTRALSANLKSSIKNESPTSIALNGYRGRSKK